MDFLELGKHPITGANPAGDDARYEPEYDALQQQIDKLSSATAGGDIDWKSIAALSRTLLSEKAKDIKVASYLGVALLHLEGVDGLSTGAQVLLDLTTNFWDTLHPAKTRLRGRFNAVSWWRDSVQAFLTGYNGPEIPQAAVDLLSQRLKDLDSALSDKAPDAPMLNTLVELAKALPAEPQAPAAQAQPQAAAPPAPASAQRVAPAAPTISGASAAPTQALGSDDEYRKALAAGLAELAAVADYMLFNAGTDRLGYRLRRIAAWLPLSVLPPADNGQTMIPPPEGFVKDAIAQQMVGRDFRGALQAAESRIGQYLFWLDLSRFSAEALDGLGVDYRDAKFAVEEETRLFVKRLGGLASLAFADGTPFADPKTRAWLRGLADDGPTRPMEPGDGASLSSSTFAEASRLAKDNRVFDAVTILQGGLSNASSGRERFLLRLGMIRLLTDVDQSALAHAHVEEVLDQIKEYRLELWEPDLALSGFTTAHDALTAEGGAEAMALAKNTLQRIGRVNPAAALKMNGLG